MLLIYVVKHVRKVYLNGFNAYICKKNTVFCINTRNNTVC